MSAAASGDRAAFGALYDAVADIVYGTVLAVLRDPTMSEEVTQDVFVELWTNAARFDPSRASVRTWVVTIARRRAVDRVRSEQSQRNRIDRLSHRRPDDTELTDDHVVASLEAQRVSRALTELPPDQRQVIELAFIDGMTHTEIAEELRLPVGTVKGRVRGGLQRLRGRLG